MISRVANDNIIGIIGHGSHQPGISPSSLSKLLMFHLVPPGGRQPSTHQHTELTKLIEAVG